MRKLCIVLCVILLVSCGSDNAAENILESQEGINNVEVTKDTTEIKTESGVEVTTTNDMAKSVEVPKDFPQDILPIYKDAIVVATQSNPDGTITLVIVSDADYDDVLEFYEKVLENAQVLMSSKEADGFLSMGELDGITYNVSINKEPDEDYEVAILLLGSPVSIIDDTTETETATETETEDADTKDMAPAEFVIPDTVTWPDNYPESLKPYDLAYAEVKDVESNSGDTMIGIMTEDILKNVVAFYEELLEDSDGYMTMAMPGGHSINGMLDGKTIMIMLFENTGQEDARYKTLIQIIYY